MSFYPRDQEVPYFVTSLVPSCFGVGVEVWKTRSIYFESSWLLSARTKLSSVLPVEIRVTSSETYFQKARWDSLHRRVKYVAFAVFIARSEVPRNDRASDIMLRVLQTCSSC
jgi:hypothetical protein